MKQIITFFFFLLVSSCQRHEIKGVIVDKEHKGKRQIPITTFAGKVHITTLRIIPEKWLVTVKDSSSHQIALKLEMWSKAQIGDSLFCLRDAVYLKKK